MITTAATFDVS